MGDGILSKFKNWIIDEDDDFDEEEYDENLENDDEEDLENNFNAINSSKGNKIVNLHTSGQMKVVVIEPKKYEEVTNIADHLKQRRTVVVNLEGLLDEIETRRSIFNFMHGAVYVLEGNMQKVSKAIFILAPSNVDIDANMKKELESKAFFPWQNK